MCKEIATKSNCRLKVNYIEKILADYSNNLANQSIFFYLLSVYKFIFSNNFHGFVVFLVYIVPIL